MTRKKESVYWDSNCFLGLLNQEADKIDKCKGVIQKAEAGSLIIITSALTFIEVIKMKGKKHLPKKAEKTIQDFFQNRFISVRNVDRLVGIKARDLMWKHKHLSPKDSVHVATALLHDVPKLHTFDSDLLKLDNKYGNPKLKICYPDIPYQGELNFT